LNQVPFVQTLSLRTKAISAEQILGWRQEYHLDRCRMSPFDHQVVGIQALVTNPFFALFDEMGAGKTKQVIDAAQVMFHLGIIDKVIVVCPAAVRSVWFDMELGELAKHLWDNTSSIAMEFHSQSRKWVKKGTIEDEAGPTKRLEWVVTNYDFLRRATKVGKTKTFVNLDKLKDYWGSKTLLVLDESSAVKNWDTDQFRSCAALRGKCGRVVLLNGTPIANNPLDMFAQGELMHSKILECKHFYQFRARYAKMGGFLNKEIIGWHQLDDLQRRFLPYVLRRLKEDCLDLPPKLPPVLLEVPMTTHTWNKYYKPMRDDMVAWLTETEVSVAQQAITKAMRLAQIVSGFLGGVDEAVQEARQIELDVKIASAISQQHRPAWIPGETTMPEAPPIVEPPVVLDGSPVVEIGREKLDWFLDWFAERLKSDRNFKLLLWVRFRPELARIEKEFKIRFPHVAVGAIHGDQRPDKYAKVDGVRTLVELGERALALRLLDPRTAPEGPVLVIGTVTTGGMGLNLTSSHTVMYLSNDRSLKDRLQSEDRVHRPGQTHEDGVSYFDVAATGPNGQKTIDHAIIKALHEKKSLATWTQAAWLDALRD